MKNKYKIINDYVIIYLKKRSGEIFETIIDIDDLPKLLELDCSWYAHYYKSPKNWYVCATIRLRLKDEKPKSKTIMLHRFLTDCIDARIRIDHIDYHPLNNRRSNLRITDNKSNLKNRTKINSNNKTGYRNVSFYNGKYLVQMQINDKNVVLGRFKDVDEAGTYASEMRKKYYGKYSGVDK